MGVAFDYRGIIDVPLPDSYEKRLEEEHNKPEVIQYKHKVDAWYEAFEEYLETNSRPCTIEEEREMNCFINKRMGEILDACNK